MKVTEVAGKWLSAHFWKTNFKAVGRTEDDVRNAYASALDRGDVVNKRWGFPLDEKAGLSIHETSLKVLKRNEIISRLSTVIPAVAGLAFLSEAYTILRETSGHGPEGAMGGLMGIIGLAAITFGQYLTWQTGEAYGQMHDWAKRNHIEHPIQATQYWPGNRSLN